MTQFKQYLREAINAGYYRALNEAEEGVGSGGGPAVANKMAPKGHWPWFPWWLRRSPRIASDHDLRPGYHWERVNGRWVQVKDKEPWPEPYTPIS